MNKIASDKKKGIPNTTELSATKVQFTEINNLWWNQMQHNAANNFKNKHSM